MQLYLIPIVAVGVHLVFPRIAYSPVKTCNSILSQLLHALDKLTVIFFSATLYTLCQVKSEICSKYADTKRLITLWAEVRVT